MAVISKLNSLLELAKERSSDRRRTLLREVTDMFFDEPPERDTAVSQEFDDVLSALPQLKAISQRELVSERLSDTIVRRGDDETVAVLIRNDGAQLSRASFETVTERAEHSKILQAPVITRKDTPADLLGDLMLTVENHLRDHILERFDGMDPALVEQALAASHARLSERMSQDKDVEEAEKFVRGMAACSANVR